MKDDDRAAILAEGLRKIGKVAAEPGEAGAMTALEEAQRIAEETLKAAGLDPAKVLPFRRMSDFDRGEK